jgi:hypothetical protein
VLVNPVLEIHACQLNVRAVRVSADFLCYTPAYFFFAALNFAQRARAAAAILFLPAADIVRFGFGAAAWALVAVFAHRAFCARLIRLRAGADTVCPELPPFNLPRTERAASTG